MKKPTPWTAAWLVWLVLFLIVEVPAAISGTKLDTFSENVWKWFGREPGTFGNGPGGRFRKTRRLILGLFMLTLSGHFVFGWPGGTGIIIAGIPVGLVILYSVVKE
jgi:hypothetical protein